jgi:hypothetical protein
MADLLSITAGIIAVLQITGKVISECLDFIKTVKKAPKELVQIYAGILSLQDVLKHIIIITVIA